MVGRRWILAIVLVAGCARDTPAVPPVTTASPPTTATLAPSTTCSQAYEVRSTTTRSSQAFTQGFTFLDGELFESTGLYGKSAIQRLDRATFEVVDREALPAGQFGEGLVGLNGLLYQLTWRENVGHVWNPDLTRVSTFAYRGEGWGITTDGTSLIRSNGSDRLVWFDPKTMQDTGEISVVDERGPVTNLNELEWVDGMVFANVWKTDIVVVINPSDGRVVARLDLAAHRPPETLGDANAVLNGLALDPGTGALLVTGKLWPTVLELALAAPCWR